MDTAQIFHDGENQAVRLPYKYRFNDSEVTVKHFAGGVLLLPKNSLLDALKVSLLAFEPGVVLFRDHQG